MKTTEMRLDALSDAKERVFNIQNSIIVLKNEMTVCGAMMNDIVAENKMNRLNELEIELTKAIELVAHYENS